MAICRVIGHFSILLTQHNHIWASSPPPPPRLSCHTASEGWLSMFPWVILSFTAYRLLVGMSVCVAILGASNQDIFREGAKTKWFKLEIPDVPWGRWIARDSRAKFYRAQWLKKYGNPLLGQDCLQEQVCKPASAWVVINICTGHP